MKLLVNNGTESIIDSVIKIILQEKHLTILSPYITNSEAIVAILHNKNFRLTIVINFDIDVLKKKAVDLRQFLTLLKRILSKGHKIYFDNNLHSKIYMSENNIILGSANFTNNGLVRRKETCISFQKASSPILFKQCEDYCREIIKGACKLNIVLVEEAINNLGVRF